VRLFVAFELPEPLKEAIDKWISKLRGNSQSGLRWSRKEGFHITLKFLGSVDAARIPEMKEALKVGVREGLPFRLKTDALGTFGDRNLWLGVTGDLNRLHKLADKVERALNPLGFEREDRPFSPHITLVRLSKKSNRKDRKILEAIRKKEVAPIFEDFEVSGVALMESVSSPDGSVYRIIFRA
jgi:RNA 2',3'-cyclic 3'-phosphodiesterase